MTQWIAAEKVFFGKADSEFDFKARSVADVRARMDELKKEQEKIGRSINKKVMAQYERAESEYQTLAAKKEIISSDKEKIEKVMAELDEKKKAALATTWSKVRASSDVVAASFSVCFVITSLSSTK